MVSIQTADGVDLTDWTLTSAGGVSADGYTIAGDGINPDGFTEAWIATLNTSFDVAGGCTSWIRWLEDGIRLQADVQHSAWTVGTNCN